MTDVSPSPEEDLEIIESTNVPTDGNTNIGPEQDVTPIDPNLLASLGSDLQTQDPSVMETIPNEEENQEEIEETNQFIAINDPNSILQPTDPTVHNKTMSETTGFDMFSFFKVEGDEPVEDEQYENDEQLNEVEPTSKRAESMTGLNKLDYDELNIENLRQFNANISRDTDDENVDNEDDAEEKEAQPNNKQDSPQSIQSQHGSDGVKQDINVEQHTLALQNQPIEQPVPPIEDDTKPGKRVYT